MKHSQYTTEVEKFEQLLQLAKLDDLVSFSKSYAAKNKKFCEDLLTFLERKYVRSKSTSDYVLQMANVFSEYRDIGDRWHSYEVRNWDSIFRKASKILDEGEKLLELGNPDGAATISLEFFKDLYNDFDMNELYDDEFMGGSEECKQAEDLLVSALEHQNISINLKEDIAAEVSELSNKDLEDYDLIDLNDLKLQVTIATASKEEGLRLLDKQIEKFHDSYEEHVYVKRKIDLLRQMGREAEADRTEKKFMYLSEIRRSVVDRKIAEKKYIEAEKLVISGIELAKVDKNSYEAGRWTKRLLEIYELQGNKARQIDVAKELFVSERGNLEYYHKLKALIPNSEWKDELAKLIDETVFSDSSFTGRSNLADIYVEEGDKEDLYKYAVGHSVYDTDALDYYSKHISDEHAEELLAIYERLLKKEASGQADVKKYPRIANSMECMSKLKGGRAAAHRLAVYFREQYPRRSSMMAAISNF